jgi:hypothetical protein
MGTVARRGVQVKHQIANKMFTSLYIRRWHKSELQVEVGGHGDQTMLENSTS